MKKIFIGLATFFTAILFAQSDFQVIAEVNLTKREPITVGELKLFVKNLEATAGQKSSVDERIHILDTLIDNKLVLQLAQKQGIKIPDSQVNEYFQYMLSSIAGQPITETQFEAQIKAQGFSSFDNFMQKQTGMTVSHYKEFIRNQLTGQAYILSSYGEEIQKIDATESEIAQAYDANKQSLVRPDMVTSFLVVVEKAGKTATEKAMADSLRARLLSNPKLTDKISKEAQKEGSGFVAGNLYLYKNEQTAKTLGITMPQLLEIFNLGINTVTEVKEMPTNFQFFVILAKDQMKFLTLNDKVDPSQDTTVREFIRNNIRMQKQNLAFSDAIKKVVETVKNDKNYKMSKSDTELRKLLSW